MKETVWISLVALVQLFAPLPITAAGAIRVMILDGQSGGSYHAWQQVTPPHTHEFAERRRITR